MNIATLSHLPDDLPGTLGKPIRREQPKPADPGRWVPASEPGYLRHTKTGAVSHEQFVPAGERPAKPAPGLYLDSGEFVPAEQINAQPAPAQPADSGEVPSMYEVKVAGRDALARGVHIFAIAACLMKVAGLDINKATDVPADRRAEVIAALNQLGG